MASDDRRSTGIVYARGTLRKDRQSDLRSVFDASVRRLRCRSTIVASR